jgi:hypothetical protein
MFGIEVDPNDILEGLKSAKDFEGKEPGEVTWSYQRQARRLAHGKSCLPVKKIWSSAPKCGVCHVFVS